MPGPEYTCDLDQIYRVYLYVLFGGYLFGVATAWLFCDRSARQEEDE